MATNERVRERVGSVQALSTVSEELARRFLAIYRDAFAPLDELAPARQSLTDEEFLDEMADTSVVKFLASDRGGVPCALAFMATDLSVVPWISLPYFQARFPEHYARGAIYYFGALLVRPELQGGAWARLLLEELVRRVASDHAVAAFDCCEHNASVTRLPELIARVGHRLSVLDAVELDPQRYFAYQFAGLR